MRSNCASAPLLAAVLLCCLCGAAGAASSSKTYRMLVSGQASVANSAAKTGGSYSLLGGTEQFGSSTTTVLLGGRYTSNLGIVNSWRPAQADVSTAHVYPNPCSLKKSCNGVTFTRLTLNAEIDIYTISGEKVRHITKTTNIDSEGWDLKNDQGQRVASGLYLFVVKGGGTTKRGKLVIVR